MTYDAGLLIKNKDKYLFGYCNDMLWLSTVQDIIRFGQTNSKCQYGQMIATKNNQGIKYYVMLFDDVDSYHQMYCPICLTDLVKQGFYNFDGYYTIKPRIANLTCELSFTLPEEVKYYKVNINNNFISNDYVSFDEKFITTPIIFSSENKCSIYCYDDNKNLVNKFQLIQSVSENNLITGILVKMI